METFGFGKRIAGMQQLRLVDPVGCFDFQRLVSTARGVLMQLFEAEILRSLATHYA
jgi:hypothetical protein